MIWRALACLLILGVLMACGSAEPTDGPEQLGPETMVASTPGGASLVLEVARSDEERGRGLMGRAEVPAGTGMIFLFGEPGQHPIWMFNCLTELDLVWLDSDRRVVHLVERAPICPVQPCPNYWSETPAVYVIEVGPGRAKELGLTPGGRVLLSPMPAGSP